MSVIGNFLDMLNYFNEEERNRFAGHALRMFKRYLKLPELVKKRSDDKSYENKVSARLARTKRLACYLFKFHPGPRRSISTQTDTD